MSPDQLAIHTFTNKPWSIHECLENYARRGIGGISIWRETLAGQDLGKVRKHLDDSGLKPVSLVRGGFFTGKDAVTREAAGVSDVVRWTFNPAAPVGSGPRPRPSRPVNHL